MCRQHQRRGNQHWQEEAVVHWEGLFRKITQLLQHRWQDSRTEFHLEDCVSTKTVRCELHKSSIHGRAAIAKPLITESNAHMRKRWCHNHKTRTLDNCKCTCDMVRWVVLHAVPYIRKGLHLDNTQGSLQSRMPGSNSERRVRFCDGLGSNIMVFCAKRSTSTPWDLLWDPSRPASRTTEAR
jgi:hypothetical protein